MTEDKKLNEQIAKNKFCPMTKEYHCLTSRCAWFNEETNKCAVNNIPINISNSTVNVKNEKNNN